MLKNIDWIITPEMKKIEELRKIIPAKSTKLCCPAHTKTNITNITIPGQGWSLAIKELKKLI